MYTSYFCVWRCIKNLKGPPFSALPVPCPSTWVWGSFQSGISHPISPLFPSMSLAILGEVCLFIALLLTTPGESSLVGWACGWLSHAHTTPGGALPFLAGRVRISPNGKLVRCESLARAACGSPCPVPAESVPVLP